MIIAVLQTLSKRIIACYSGLTILIICAAVSNGLAQGRTLPPVEVKTLNGQSVDISTIKNKGRPMIVFAWEITCRPGIAELNVLARRYDDWHKETGVTILAVSVDDSRSSPRVQPLVKSKGWPFDFYLDPNQAFKRAMGITYCPYVFILNGNGEVVWQKVGYTPGDEEIIYETIKKAMNGEKIEQ